MTLRIPAKLCASRTTIPAGLDLCPKEIHAELKTEVHHPAGEYGGEYTVVPSDRVQTLYTLGKVLDGNIVINPIPSNYGRIEWNGSYLTVS